MPQLDMITLTLATVAFVVGGAAAVVACLLNAGAASRQASLPGSQFICGICFEASDKDDAVSAQRDPHQPSSSSTKASCMHLFCRGCMTRYAMAEIQKQKYPISCPDPDCNLEVQSHTVHTLLQDNTSALQVIR